MTVRPLIATRETARARLVADDTELFARSEADRIMAVNLIHKAMAYRSGENDINEVYMGSWIHALILGEVGLAYSGNHKDFGPRLWRADAATVARVKGRLQWIIDYMINHPVETCPCCGRITLALNKRKKAE
jgi:hypothetical protein